MKPTHSIKGCGALACVLVLLGGCASGGGGGRYASSQDAYPTDGRDLSQVPDAVPKVEPLAASGNRPVYQVLGKSYQVMSDARGYSATGIASFYGTKFHGYDTASGERYDMYAMSAAHRSLPLPTYARVTNLDNQRSVIVKVNDRGPFHDDRLIDLSYAAAYRLDVLARGTARVKVEAIDPASWPGEQDVRRIASTPTSTPAAPPSAGIDRSAPSGAPIFLQVAALGSAQNAARLRDSLQSRLSQPVRISENGALHRVQVGPFTDPTALETVRARLAEAGYLDPLLVNGSG